MRMDLFNGSFKIKTFVNAADAMLEKVVEEINEAIVRLSMNCLKAMGFRETGAAMGVKTCVGSREFGWRGKETLM